MHRFPWLPLLVAALASCQHSSSQTRASEPESIESTSTERPETTAVSTENTTADSAEGGGPASTAIVAEPAREEPAPIEKPPLTAADVVVTSFDSAGAPARPEMSGGCVDHSAALQFRRQTSTYHDSLAYTAAEKKGWLRLRDVVAVGFDRSSQQYRPSAIEIAEVRDDRLIDANGHHWLGMRSWTCTPPAANYYIDEDLNVFALTPDPKCRKSHMKGCGTFPTYGCGHLSAVVSRHYVRVPEQAAWSGDRSIIVRPKVCISIEPQDGYGAPPP